jgi:hypothetical protein
MIWWCCQELHSRKRVFYSDQEPTGSSDNPFAADSVSRMRSVMAQILAMETVEVRESRCRLYCYFGRLKGVAPNLVACLCCVAAGASWCAGRTDRWLYDAYRRVKVRTDRRCIRRAVAVGCFRRFASEQARLRSGVLVGPFASVFVRSLDEG